MIEAYTDHYLPVLGDWLKVPVMRKVTLTRYDGNKECRGVIDGVVVRLPIARIYHNPEKRRFRKSELMKLLYTEVI
jgi:hypothetical protein